MGISPLLRVFVNRRHSDYHINPTDEVVFSLEVDDNNVIKTVKLRINEHVLADFSEKDTKK